MDEPNRTALNGNEPNAPESDNSLENPMAWTTSETVRDILAIRGGGAKKKTFEWKDNDEAQEILLNCAVRAEESGLPFKQTLFEYFCQSMKDIGYNYKFTIGSVTGQYAKIKEHQKPDRKQKKRKNIDWKNDTAVCEILIECGLRAIAERDRDLITSVSDSMYQKFTEQVTDYEGEKENLRKKFHDLCREERFKDFIGLIEYQIDEEMTKLDLKAAVNSDNMPTSLKEIEHFRKLLNWGKELGRKNIYHSVCFNCGKLLFGEQHISKTWKLIPYTGQTIPIEQIYDEIPAKYPYLFEDENKNSFLYKCRVCEIKPDILKHVRLLTPEINKMRIPPELGVITNRNDLEMIALLGVYTRNITREDRWSRVFSHFQGEINLRKKQEKSYKQMVGIMREKRNPIFEKTKASEEVVAALKWLKKNNHLYKYFYANCETILEYFGKPTDPNLIQGATEVVTTKGKDIGDELGEEEIGYFVPADNIREDGDITENDVSDYGIVHPKDPKNFIRPGVFNPNLEAMAFPKLFPGGTGSFNPGSPIKQRMWDKLLLHNLDDRFRRDRYLTFFMIDRYIKISLIQHKRMVIAEAGEFAVEKPTVKDLKEGEGNEAYRKFGTKVPASIPGSRSYWFTAQQEVFAISEEMQRNPDFFLTATEYDGWPEIQRCIAHQVVDECDKCPHDNDNEPAVNFATECSIAFHRRWLEFKKRVLQDPKGGLGKVIRYWFRREYQKRGAVHIHGVVWVEPGTKPENVVRAEMPRGGNDPKLTAELRELVKKYQTHNCIDKCFSRKGKRLNNCKLGYPQPLVNATRPDETGLRNYYRRREKEDQRIVPYCIPMISIFRSHTNIQEVSKDGWEFYLTKYMTKPEKQTRVRKDVSDTERYLTMRVIGAVEANDTLNMFWAKESDVEVEYLPIELTVTTRVLKRKEHLPEDSLSSNVYYDNKFEKYLLRPKELEDVTYPDFFRHYILKGSKRKDDTEDIESDHENTEPTDKTKPMKDLAGRIVVKRRHPVVIRFPFLLPYGEHTEQFCVKILLEKIPIRKLDDLISPNNEKKSYLDECMLRHLWEKAKIAEDFLDHSINYGLSETKLREMAVYLIQNEFITVPDIAKWFKSHADKLMGPNEPNYEFVQEENIDDKFFGEYPVKDLELEPLEVYINSFTDDQARIFNDIRDKFIKNEQCLACVVGPAGTGKSHLLKAICALAKTRADPEKGIPNTLKRFFILAPTGSAAYLIKGLTIHQLFRLDFKNMSWIKKNTIWEWFIKRCELFLIDEMSMIDNSVFSTIEDLCRHFVDFKDPFLLKNKFFADKSVIIFGDPLQLPSHGIPLFCGKLFRLFNIYNLRTIVRQKDVEFTRILSSIRMGIVTPEAERAFKSRLITNFDYKELIDKRQTIVVSLRRDCDTMNDDVLSHLEGEEFVFNAIDTSASGTQLTEHQEEKLSERKDLYPRVLKLKVNATVILRRNINTAEGLVNGRVAIVESITQDSEYPKNDFVILRSLDGKQRFPIQRKEQSIEDFGQKSYVRFQLPIVLGFAATVHRVQGMTVNDIIIKLDRSFFASGQAYVALTRTRSLDQIRLLAFDKDAVILKPFYKQLITWMDEMDVFNKNGNKQYPFPAWPDKFEDKVPHPRNEDPVEPNPPKKTDTEDMDIDIPEQQMEVDIPNSQQPMEIDNREVMRNTCHQILAEIRRMLGNTAETEFENMLIEVIDNNQYFCESVLKELRQAEPLTTDAFLQHQLKSCVTRSQSIPTNMHPYYQLVDVSRDGDCFYHDVSVHLFGDESMSIVVRFGALVMIANNYKYYNELTGYTDNANMRWHLKNTATPTEWASSLQMLAVSEAIHRQIITHSPGNNNGPTRPRGPPTKSMVTPSHLENMVDRKLIRVLLEDAHFQSIIPRPVIVPEPPYEGYIIGLPGRTPNARTITPINSLPEDYPRRTFANIDN